MNTSYELCNKLYLDACIQPGKKENEFRALTDIVDRLIIPENAIVIADLGFESYNVFAHIEEKGWNYIIRVNDINSSGIVCALKLPDTDEFDTDIDLNLTRKQTKQVKSHLELYRFLNKSATFDYLDLNENKLYPISFRVVRFKISDEAYVTIVTNLGRSQFPPKEIKRLYHMRWGIEASFRELKYAIGLSSFRSNKVEYIAQEVFARLIMYNFCEMITLHVIISQKATKKHVYQVNFTMAIHFL